MLYHDDFNAVNPLGNKVSKYKFKCQLFVLLLTMSETNFAQG